MLLQWLFLGTLMLVVGSDGSYSANDTSTRLAKHLFEDYLPDIFPNCSGHRVVVRVGMALRAILDVDEPSQIVSVTVWMRLNWNDCRLQWNTTEYPVDELVVASQRIWVPDITLFDSTGEGLEKVAHYRPILYPDGTVFFMGPTIINFSCKMDVTYFPYDRQQCKIKFASWSYDGLRMDVTNRSDAADTRMFVDNGEWNLIGVPARRNLVYYACCPEPFPDVTFYLVMQRQYLYYFFNLVMPCVLITAISLLVFCLPPESGEKISLGITVLLSLCVFLLMVSERMPATSETIPLIAQYFAATIILASISCGMTVVVLNVHHRGYDGSTVPTWLKVCVIDYLGVLLCITKEKPKLNRASGEKAKQGINPLLSCSAPVFPAPSAPTSELLATTENHVMDVGGGGVQKLGHLVETSDNSSSTAVVVRLLAEMLEVLRRVGSHVAGQEEEDRVTGEWRQVALVLDRLFFIINTVLVLLVSLVILLRHPSHTDWSDLDKWR